MIQANRYTITLIFVALWYAMAFGQSKQPAAPTAALLLRVTGEVARPLNLTADDWRKLPRRSVRARDHDGKAADHYRAVFALPELDHAFTDRVVLLADRRDGKPLATNESPLHLVVPDEKRAGTLG